MQKANGRLVVYLLALYLVGGAILAMLTRDLLLHPSRELFVGLGFFLALSVIASSSPVTLPRGSLISMGFAVEFACLLIYGPAVAAWVSAISAVILLHNKPKYRVAFNVAQLATAMGLAGWAYSWAGGAYVFQHGAYQRVLFHHYVGELSLAAIVLIFGNMILVTTAVALSSRRALVGTWLAECRWMIPQFFSLAPFGVLMAIVYQLPNLRILALLLFLLPLFWARYAFKGYMDMREVYRQTVQALTTALEAYDPYTQDHSDQVTNLAEAIAQQMRFPETRMDSLLFAARLHDIGKFAMEPVLNKKEALTEQDWEMIRQHPVEGERIVAAIEIQPGAARIVRATHERLDGKGYPDGLRGEQIDLAASIVAVADAFHAMISNRAYRDARPLSVALAELDQNAGSQFDPRAVEALKRLVADGRLPAETR
jgi:HD-GYP domain-containing protein (c-di-GMP phosphodiesterase class II)